MEPPEPPQTPQQPPWYGEPAHYPTQRIDQPTQHLPSVPPTGPDHGPWGAPPTSHSANRHRSLWIAVAAGLAVAVVVATFVLARAYSSHKATSSPSTVPQAVLGPVVLVPGYGGHTTDLALLQTTLQSAGRDVTIMSLPGDGTGDLTQQARTLDNLVASLLQSSGQPSVDVVGYSAGGIVARIWARDLGGDKIARRIVTMGSPHHGTTVAGLASLFGGSICPQACQELKPGSSLLNSLNEDHEVQSGPQYVSLWSDNDDVVKPPETAHLEGAANIRLQALCPLHFAAHANLVTDPVVLRAVAIELGDGPTTDTPAVTC